MPKAPKSPQPKTKIPNFLKVSAIIAVLLGGAYLVVDHPYAQRFTKANNEMERIRHEVIEPMGGVELSGGGYKPTLIGGEFLRFTGCGFDLQCPEIGRAWFVPIEPGQEQKAIQSIAKSAGYRLTDNSDQSCVLQPSSSCGVTAEKDGFSIVVTIRSNSASQSPTRKVDPKIWRAVSLSVVLD